MLEEIPVEERKYDEYCGELIANTNLKLLYFTQQICNGPKKSVLKVHYLECQECKKDPELYGNAIYKGYLYQIKRGMGIPCGCSKSVRRTSQQFEVIIRRLCEAGDVRFIGFCEKSSRSVPTKSSDITTRDRVCLRYKDYVWDALISDVLKTGLRNPVLGKEQRDRNNTYSDEKQIKLFMDTGVFAEGTIFKRLGTSVDIPNQKRKEGNPRQIWEVTCSACGESYMQRADSVSAGHKLCSCKANKRFTYLIKIDENYLKFGITSKAKAYRCNVQMKKTSLPTELLGFWEYPNKASCLAAELWCMKNLETSVISKRDYPDGWTETTYLKNIDTIIANFEQHGGIKV